MEIEKLLRLSRTRESSFTHVSMGNFKCKYYLSRTDLEDFFSSYNPEKNSICVAEIPQNYTPILVDIDIKRKSEDATSQRTEKHITDVIKTYQQIIKEIISDIKPKDLTCILLDKPIYQITQNNTNYIKNGFHLHFPYIFLNKNTQKIHLIPRVKKVIKQLKTFEDLGFQDSEKLIDDITDKPWLIYGASKEEGKEPYRISKVYDCDCNEISLEKALLEYPLQNIQEQNIKLNSRQDIVKHLTRILSIIPLNRDLSVIKEPINGLENPNKVLHKEKRQIKKYKNKNSKDLLQEASQLVKIISDYRADDRKDWLTVGWCLFNISEGSDEGFDIWNEFSQRCVDKYDESCCEYTWNKMAEGSLGIGTLHYFAKQDNNEAYNKFIKDNIKDNNKDILYEEIKKKAKSRRSKKEQAFLEQINEKILDNQIESLFNYENNDYIYKEDIPKTQEFVKDIVFPKGYRCIGMHAGLGRGKTSAIIRQVKGMKPDADVLVLSPRVTFAENMCADYNSRLDESRQFICYKNVKNKKQLNFKNKIVISMEGLHYLESYTPELLIIDECNANLIAHIADTNGNNLDKNIYQFNRLLKYSKNVVVADAFIGSKVCNFFTDLRIPLYIYKYHRKLDRKDAVLLEPTPKEVKKEINKKFTSREDREYHKFNIDPTVNTILKLLKNGKKIYAFFSTKTLLEDVEKKTKDYNCLFYSGVSQNTIPDNLDNVWSQYDLVGTTCTITVGINHSKTNVFNTKIIDFNSSSKNNISDAIQSHYRVRNIIDDKIYVKIDENHIANNFPVSIENLEENIQHKVMWYKQNGKCFETVEKHINNLIKHNYLENQLSQVAPKKMMIRYLKDCNYNIIQETGEAEEAEEVEIDEEDVEEKDDDDEKVNLLKEFAKDCPNFCRFKELETKKMTRKLTQKELNEIDKYWFIQMYTGGTIKGHQEASLPTIALAYRLWQAKFKGNKTIRAMRLEKKLLKGQITIEELIEKRWDKTQYAELQSSDIIKIKRVLEVCKRLGLKHSNDCTTVITQESIDDFYDEAQGEYENIRKDLGIRDQRKDKNVVNKKIFTGLLKSCFTESDQSLCNLKLHQTVQKKINGKKTRTNTYKLYPDKYVCGEMKLVNCLVEGENKEDHKYDKINNDEVTQMLYEKLDLREPEQEKPIKKLLKKN